MEYHQSGIYLQNGMPAFEADMDKNAAREATMAYRILRAHEKAGAPKDGQMHLVFDAMISHDITYVGIIQTARASGLEAFPMPYALTNCHNSLCAVGGTINEDDHAFGLSAAKKYGGIYVPANQAVIHQYAREMMSACGAMILGSDSHTRYGAYGTMGIGEGGPELVKQLLHNTYDIPCPEVTLVYVTGKLEKGVGPHDVAIALCKETFGKVKNNVLEFVGPGIANLSTDERIGIDVMTTETSCLSSIWETDEKVEEFYRIHGRSEGYAPLKPGETAYYDHYVMLDLSEVEPMAALPFHPSNAVTIRELKQDPMRYLAPLGLEDKIVDGKIHVDQGEIAGCAGGLYENIEETAAILKDHTIGCGNFTLNIYPASTPIEMRIAQTGTLRELLLAGAVIKPAFCGPCFGAGDVPQNHGLSIRHATRNFPSREGSKPGEGQSAFVMLMDARSIAATAANGGFLTGADELDYEFECPPYVFEKSIYEKRCYNGALKPQPEEPLVFGPNITDWPKMEALKDDLLVRMDAVIRDEVTTTDELIPSGETSSYRSNPLRLARFALSRREPAYVGRTEETAKMKVEDLGLDPDKTSFGSAIFCNKPGDGSAREQAASCQRVLGGAANFAIEYATKRYRSNCINWGMIPFTTDAFPYETGSFIYVPGIRKALESGAEAAIGYVYVPEKKLSEMDTISLHMGILNETEREILLRGCLMNYYKAHQA